MRQCDLCSATCEAQPQHKRIAVDADSHPIQFRSIIFQRSRTDLNPTVMWEGDCCEECAGFLGAMRFSKTLLVDLLSTARSAPETTVA